MRKCVACKIFFEENYNYCPYCKMPLMTVPSKQSEVTESVTNDTESMVNTELSEENRT